MRHCNHRHQGAHRSACTLRATAAFITRARPSRRAQTDNASTLATFLKAPYESGKKSIAVKQGEKRKIAETKKNKATKKGGKKAKSAGAASGLKRPPSAYLLYCNNKRAKVVAENPCVLSPTSHLAEAALRLPLALRGICRAC